jgi:hypothetical protein
MGTPPTPWLPGCDHPLAAGALGAFLAGSTTTLVGRLDPDGGVGGAVVVANPALALWLRRPCPADLARLLSAGSLERLLRVVEKLRSDGEARVVPLRFLGSEEGTAARRAGVLYRCLLTVDREGVARFGGEEFLVFLPGTGRAGALLVAERLRAGLAERPAAVDVPDAGAAGRLTLTASLGLAEHLAGEPAARLLERADAALVRAKSAGRNRVEADPGPDA